MRTQNKKLWEGIVTVRLGPSGNSHSTRRKIEIETIEYSQQKDARHPWSLDELLGTVEWCSDRIAMEAPIQRVPGCTPH